MKVSITNKSWFEEWFDSSYYHTLYQHRDHDEACRFINYLLSELQPPENSKMLDLGCSSGRHSIHLAKYGFDVTGIDLSLNSIQEAQRFSSNNLRFKQVDMRQPFDEVGYNYILRFFTSFGYFDTHENIIVVKNMAAALKPGGTLVIDYLNTNTTLKNLVPFEVIEKDSISFFITRWFDEKFIYKQIEVSDLRNRKEVLFTERVRRFNLNDFVKMFGLHGVTLVDVYGDYELNEYRSELSKRLILVFGNKHFK